MSFTFNWPRFSDQFHYDAIQMLNTALNKGNKPPIIADKIEVVELEMGTQPPELEIRDIGDLTVDQFRGIFRLTYSGDAHLVLKTKVQANPLNHKQPDIHLMGGSRGMLAAKQPLVVPMLLRLSHFQLSSYVVLVVSKQKGITLVFKTDPLQNVDINSTFDSIAVIQKFIQKEIEGQLRQMFREDLPGIIHRLSQQWVKAKVEAPYLEKRPPPVQRQSFDAMSVPDLSMHRAGVATSVGLQPQLLRHQSLGSPSLKRTRSVSGASTIASTGRTPSTPKSLPQSRTTSPDSVTFPDIENFDPTYGLRPEGLPTKSGFQGFSSLFQPNKGLADLAEEPSEPSEYDDEGGSFDFVDWGDTIPGVTPPPSTYNDPGRDSPTEYETIPAVGGGTITRPRVYHSQSAILIPSGSGSSLPGRSRSHTNNALLSPRSGIATPGLAPRYPGSSYNPYFPDHPLNYAQSVYSRAASVSGGVGGYRTPLSAPPYSTTGRPRTPDSSDTHPSRSSGSADKLSSPSPDFDDTEDGGDGGTIYMRQRRLSVSSATSIQSSSSPTKPERDPKIVLRPSLNSSLHHLSTLSHSYHTLSPYTRSLSHFTVRSVPPRGAGSSGLSNSMERAPVKAKRKRMYRIGGKKAAPPELKIDPLVNGAGSTPPPLTSPVPPSEFDEADMDRYFRSTDDLVSREPNIHPTHLRRRPSLHLS
ncbi:hypothetical protein BDQ12DRAFT_675621 [Crucibulum laeve]|uniref:Mitochondrial distribution and morphology protein 34 n=1 Tax=Crucibulum laeve TaxID=68775 RepID=A0A5C3MFW5_9AGAR|nr:hypothetical protein BDQ12DRAFT_675621 [Crucibulum laeve]